MLALPIIFKTEQMRRIILDAIASGPFPEARAIPSENFPSRQFGSSRNAVREASSSLSSEGCLRPIQGKGTFNPQPSPLPAKE